MRIRFITAPTRPKPRAGDRKMIKGVEHVRTFRRAPCGALVVSGSRYLYDWTPVTR